MTRHAPPPAVTTAPTGRSARGAVGTLPFACATLVALNGLYMLLVAFGNITDYATNEAFVRHVLSEDTTNFGAPAGTGLDPDLMWRAVTSPALQTVAYLGVIVWEAVAAVVLATAVVLRVRTRRATEDTARRVATAGLLMIVVLFFGGFIDVGGEWFGMWRSTVWNGLDPAFRNCMLALVTLVLLHLPGEDRRTASPDPAPHVVGRR